MKSQKNRARLGFTLIEILVSLFLFGVASLGLGRAFATSLALNTRNERRTAGVQAVQRVLDGLRLVDPSTMPSVYNTQQTSTEVIGNRTFAMTTIYCPTASNTYCNSNIREIKVQARLNNQLVYETSTIYSKLR